MRPSCTKLAKLLIRDHKVTASMFSGNLADYITAGKVAPLADYLRNMCEAFGRDVQCFISTTSPEQRTEFQLWCLRQSIGFSRSYWPGSGVASVDVAYFKAWHWDE